LLLLLLFALQQLCCQSLPLDSSSSSSSSQTKAGINLVVDDHVFVEKQFHSFVARYGREYADEKERAKRFENFKSNHEFIVKHNADTSQTYRVAINQFADLSTEEYITQYASGFKRAMGVNHNSFNGRNPAPMGVFKPTQTIPNETDWRLIGGVSPISNQGQCGSSPFFAAIVSIEGLRNRITGQVTVPLSTQQAISCDKQDNGCDGADYSNIFGYIVRDGLQTDAQYPYISGDSIKHPCHYNESEVVFNIGSYANITSGDEDQMAYIVATNSPIATIIDASYPGFEFYESGIYTSTKCDVKGANHGISIVGYGETWTNKEADLVPYWILKNTWTTQWGEEGFMRLVRGKKMCGIAYSPHYPLPRS